MADLGEIGSASVALRADGKRLKRDLDRARVGVRKSADKAGREFGQRFGASAKRFIGPALAGILSVAAIRGFVRGAQKAIDKLDEIAKTADGIGLTTDALQELRVAADLSGVDIGALNSSLRRFARTASDANNDLSTAVRAFESVGVSVTDTDGRLKDIDILLEDVADGFAGMTNATQRAATAQELFGRAGTTMVNLLVQGSDGISRMRQEARDLGIVIDESLIRQSVIAKDELTLLNRVIDVELTVSLVRLGPLLVGIAGFLSDIVTATANAAEGFRRLANNEIFSEKASQLRIELSESRAELNQLSIDLQAFAKTGKTTKLLSFGAGVRSGGLFSEADTFEQALDKVAFRADEISSRISEIQAELVEIAGENLPTIFTPTTPTIPPGPPGPDGFKDTTAATIDEIQRLIDSEIQLREEIGATIATLGEEEGARERLLSQIELDRIARELDAAAIAATTDEQRQEIKQAKELLPILRAITDARVSDQQSLRDQEDALADAAQAERAFAGALRSTADELTRAIFEGGNFLQILANLALRLIEIRAIQLTQGASGGGLLNTFIGAVLGAVGAGVGGISIGAGAGGGGSALTNISKTIPRFAEGGAPPIGQFSLVGEGGPELAFFGAQARVFSNDDLRDALSGGAANSDARPVNVTMNITTPDVGSFRRSQSQVSAELGRMIRQGQARQT